MALLLLGACENFPGDPKNTTAEVRGAVLKVGVIENPPWASARGGDATGIEVDLLERFAATLDAEVEWSPVPTEAGFEKLKKGEIHLLIGGLLQSTPYSRHAGLTRPYVIIPRPGETVLGLFQKKDRHVMAGVRGENRLFVLLENFLKTQSIQVDGVTYEARP